MGILNQAADLEVDALLGSRSPLVEAMRVEFLLPSDPPEGHISMLADECRMAARTAPAAVAAVASQRAPRRRSGRRFGLAGRVAVPVLGIPLLTAGLAIAGVRLPPVAADAFDRVGIELPNQASQAASVQRDPESGRQKSHGPDAIGQPEEHGNRAGRVPRGPGRRGQGAEGRPGSQAAANDSRPGSPVGPSSTAGHGNGHKRGPNPAPGTPRGPGKPAGSHAGGNGGGKGAGNAGGASGARPGGGVSKGGGGSSKGSGGNSPGGSNSTSRPGFGSGGNGKKPTAP